ncbi:E3 ubiquitin-protein ligase RSL1 [Arachis stenosperma]|uniref:E3 ubiquitin-protein ligase RSL1 n=1 Tax=Arachis stenosperma TaxID=217475 RepID=UPI0025ACF66F|nr:E3 ubiquitin-protein ligase RSL1 [Arachis stenosperma]
MDSDDDLHRLLLEQRRELATAEAIDSDLEFAYRLQLEEALAASLASLPSSSSPQPPPPPPPTNDDKNDAVLNATTLQAQELARVEQELRDRHLSEAEARKTSLDLNRRVHDQKVAIEILRMPEDDWVEWGDNFEKPFFFGEGSSSSSSTKKKNTGKGNLETDEGDDGAVFRVYFKGLVSKDEKLKNGEKVLLAGIGVAICDPEDNLILEVRKPLIGCGTSKIAADLKALIEGLNAAFALDLKRVQFFCDYYPIFQFVRGRWPVKQRKVALLVNQVNVLRRKFTYCAPMLLARHDVKYAFKLAREAIVSQLTAPADSNGMKNLNETCVICLEDTDGNNFFSVDGCQHRYCFSCMRQHVEVKLLHGMVPKCPHEGCNSELQVDSCKKFLTNKLIETMQLRKLEASIPVTEKVYCPYPRCSALMSKTELFEYSKNLIGDFEQSGPKKCIKCHGLFCFTCKVPWHSGMKCYDYKRLNPNPPAEDLKLKFLASRSLWRQCVKCNHMIELAEGCYHMTCRCGYEFCYNCGAEWKNKKATCSCPLWAEDNIWFEDHARDSDEEEEEEEEDDEFFDSDYSDDEYY